MARAALSDEELRTQLEKFGVRAGPITDTTRELYLGKLKKLTTSKTSETAATKSGTGSNKPQFQTVTPPSSPRTPKQPSGLECSSPVAAAIPARHPGTTQHYIPSQCKKHHCICSWVVLQPIFPSLPIPPSLPPSSLISRCHFTAATVLQQCQPPRQWHCISLPWRWRVSSQQGHPLYSMLWPNSSSL